MNPKHYLTLLCFIIIGTKAFTQSSGLNYSYTTGANAWLNNASPVVIHSGGFDNQLTSVSGAAFPITWSGFDYGGITYTSVTGVWISSNGFFSLINPGNSTPVNSLANNPYCIIAPFWDDLKTDSIGSVNYKFSGSGTNEYLTIEWYHMLWDHNATIWAISFQVRIYERTHTTLPSVIDFRYFDNGGGAVNKNAGSGGTSIGLSGFCNGDFYNFTSNAGAPTKAAPEVTNISLKPAQILYYRFTPVAHANDNCGTAQHISFPSSTAGSTVNATQSIAPALCWSFAAVHDVWFAFEKPAGVTSFEIFTDNADCRNTDIAMEIFTGCGGTSIGCTDTGTGGIAGATSYLKVINQISNGKQYWVRVATDNLHAGYFRFNVRAAGTTSCITPYGMTATNITPTSAVAAWTYLVVADTFRIRYSVSGSTNYLYKQIVGSTGSTATLTSLSPTTTYQYQVESVCGNDSSTGYSTSFAFTTPTPCIQPYGLSTSNITINSALVRWSNLVAADTFRVRYYAFGTTTYLYKEVNGLSGNSAPLTGLSPSTTYQFQVSSVCLGVGGSYSSLSSFTTLTPVACAVPYSLNAASITTASAIVSWTNLVAADTFRIRYSVFGTTAYTYKDVNGAAGSSASLTGLVQNTSYQFQVASVCSGVNTGYSASYSFTTLPGPVPCSTPNTLTTTNITNTSAVVNWTALVTADSFLVKYWISGTTAYNWKQVSGAGGVHNMQLTGLTHGSIYNWQVRSVCTGVAPTAYSSVASFTLPMRLAAAHQSESADELVIYPNPTHGEFAVAGLQLTSAELTIYNTLGEVVYATVINEKKLTINTNLLSGIYFVRVIDGKINVMKKLIVE